MLQVSRQQVWRKFFLWSVFSSFVGLAITSSLLPAFAAVQGLGRESNSLLTPGQTGNSNPPKPRQSPRPGAVSMHELRHNLRNGVYLFGDADVPNQTQRSYFVFQVENQRVVGAVYMPGSSFDCFYGTQKPGNLDVQVFDSFENSYYPQAVVLTDYYSLPQVSGNDQRILQTCRAASPQPSSPPLQLRSKQ